MLLLQHNADVNVINGEGRLARHMTPTNDIGDEIKDLLRAAEATESLRKVKITKYCWSMTCELIILN